MKNFKERFKFCHFDGYDLTEQSKESMYNYFVHGLEPGGFMTCVLSNDLFGAASRADFENRKQLYGYTAWMAAYAPYQSYGSPEIVKGWLSKNEYYHQFQKELVAERLAQPE